MRFLNLEKIGLYYVYVFAGKFTNLELLKWIEDNGIVCSFHQYDLVKKYKTTYQRITILAFDDDTHALAFKINWLKEKI